MDNRAKNSIILFQFLGVAGRSIEDHNIVANEIRKKINEIIARNPKYLKDLKEDGQEDDLESWYYWRTKIPVQVGQNDLSCELTIKHFKVRIILEIEIETKEIDFINLYKEARKLRSVLSKNDFFKSNFFKKYECNKETRFTDHVEQLYWYPLIQIPMKYLLKDYNQLRDESITSFLYEVHDAKREGFWSQFFSPKFALIRVSRPSIITTNISKFMQDEIINAIYDTCLHSLRAQKVHTISDEIFREMRDYIGQVLFNHEEMVANAYINRGLQYIQIIIILGVLSSTLALIVLITNFNSWEGVKSLIAFILFCITLIIMAAYIHFQTPRQT
jgi:hypothetical protein